MDPVSLSGREAVEVVDGVTLAQLAAGDRMSVQHFEIEPWGRVPEHSHRHEQAGFVYAGRLRFVVDGDPVAVGPGDSYAIPGETPHAAENRGEETVRGVDVFSPPRPDPDWLD